MAVGRSGSRFRAGTLAGVALTIVAARADAQDPTRDSLRTYVLSEIVVGETAPRRADPAAVRRVPLAEIVRSDAPSVASVARLVPAAHVQTNSRGETLVYLRGAGERQVAVYLDGVALNVPWDNRIDLSFVPSSIIESVGVAHGASSVLYGTNAVGGVLLLATRGLERAGRLTEFSASGGSAGWTRLEGLHQARRGRGSLLAAAGWSSSDGLPLPRGADLPFEPSGGGLRVNTDRRLGHGFLRAGWDSDRIRIAASGLHANGTHGVAPEGHLDPVTEPVRYWRYPWWRMTLAAVNLAADAGRVTSVRATAWLSRFSQRIDQYASVAYVEREERQDDVDRTAGARMTLDTDLGTKTLVTAATVFASEHRQEDAPGAGSGIVARYRQVVYSLGAELRGSPGPGVRGQVGLGVEGMATPRTGDKPPRPGEWSWTASTGIVADVAPGWSVRAAAGRKLRFATPRELFGTALGRFLANDDLRPESSWTVDAGVVRPFRDGEIETTLFLRRTFDTIDQENVVVDGRNLRRRINLPGTRAVGVEVAGRLEPREGLEVEGHLTAMAARVLGRPTRSRTVEKPDVLGTLIATWSDRRGLAITLQGTYTGRAWGLGPDNGYLALPRSLLVDARVAVRRLLPRTGVFAEAFVRVDNVFDTLALPQPGLPQAGRSARGGISLTF